MSAAPDSSRPTRTSVRPPMPPSSFTMRMNAAAARSAGEPAA